MDLTAFKNLRHVSWLGIGTDIGSRRALNNWFKSSVEHIQTLHLGFGPDYDNDREQVYPLLAEVLDLKPGDENPRFPSLRSLALSNVRFFHRCAEIIRFFNIGGLYTLRLDTSWDQDHLLETLVESNVPVNLTTLVLILDTGYEVHPCTNPTVLFLESFRGLQHLYIELYCCSLVYSPFLRVAAKHPLKEFVFSLGMGDGFCDNIMCCTLTGFLAVLYDSVEPLLNSILTGGTLECLGIPDSLILLVC